MSPLHDSRKYKLVKNFLNNSFATNTHQNLWNIINKLIPNFRFCEFIQKKQSLISLKIELCGIYTAVVNMRLSSTIKEMREKEHRRTVHLSVFFGACAQGKHTLCVSHFALLPAGQLCYSAGKISPPVQQ